MCPSARTSSVPADERGWGERASARVVAAVTGLRMQDWWEASELVGGRIVDADDRVASTERITRPGSPDWAVTLHDDRQVRPVTAEITLLTEPGMSLQQEQLVTGRQRSPRGRWFLDVRRLSNDPPSLEDDEPVKMALRKIITAEAPVAAACLEDHHGGVSEMREWQQAHQQEMPPWHYESQALCAAIVRKCVTEVPGFAAVHSRHEVRLRMTLTNISDDPGVAISQYHHGYGGALGDLRDVRDHVQLRIDLKSTKQQSLHPGEKWLVALCVHPLLTMMMQHAFSGDGEPMHDKTLAPLEEIRLDPFDEVWIAAPRNSEGDEARIVKLALGQSPLVTSCAL